MKNEMEVTFSALAVNEAFGRMVVGAFLLPLNPTLDVLDDVRTAVSEAVTNAIVHGYQGKKEGNVTVCACLEEGLLTVTISDAGIGIRDVQQAMTPLFTTAGEQERSGMGFTVMETFMDTVEVRSEWGKGTTVKMAKKL